MHLTFASADGVMMVAVDAPSHSSRGIGPADVGLALTVVVAMIAALVPAWPTPWQLVAVIATLAVAGAYLAVIRIRAARRRREEMLDAERSRTRAALDAAERATDEAQMRAVELAAQLRRATDEHSIQTEELHASKKREEELVAEVDRLAALAQEIARVGTDEINAREAELELLRNRDDWFNERMNERF